MKGSPLAEEVDLERIALPVTAAFVSPLDHLCPERAKVFRDLEQIVDKSATVPAGLRGCHRVAADKEFELELDEIV